MNTATNGESEMRSAASVRPTMTKTAVANTSHARIAQRLKIGED